MIWLCVYLISLAFRYFAAAAGHDAVIKCAYDCRDDEMLPDEAPLVFV